MKNMAKGLLVLAALSFGQQSMAADAPELKVEHSIVINATPDEVWTVAGDFNGIPRWLPTIAASRMILGKN
ncbi:MAG TPA: SRPBCC family protein, partial [Burkholderiales bacterium]|nr:SRPBCC family protein [Burkholderiales bacterium]